MVAVAEKLPLMHHYQHISKACGFFVLSKGSPGKSRGAEEDEMAAAVSLFLLSFESFMAFLVENQFSWQKHIFLK